MGAQFNTVKLRAAFEKRALRILTNRRKTMNVMAIRIDQIGNAVRLVERLGALLTPEEEFESLKDKHGDVYVYGVHLVDVEEMIADISDERLCEEYALFVEFIREAKDIMKID